MNDETHVRLLLDGLLGRRATIEGRRMVVWEVLIDEGFLVLREEQGDPVVQRDQFGEAARRVTPTWTVPLRSAVDQGSLHPVVAMLLDAQEVEQIADWLMP